MADDGRTDNLPRFLTMADVQAAMGGPTFVSLRQLQRMAKNGEIPGTVKVGKRYVFQRVPFTTWVDGGAHGVVIPLRRQA